MAGSYQRVVGGSRPYLLNTVTDFRGATKMDLNLPCRGLQEAGGKIGSLELSEKASGQVKTCCGQCWILSFEACKWVGLAYRKLLQCSVGHGSSITPSSSSTSSAFDPNQTLPSRTSRQCALLFRHAHPHDPPGAPLTGSLRKRRMGHPSPFLYKWRN